MKLIPLDAILAEINRLIAELVEKGENTMFEQGRISAFEDAKLFLDTLEVKEVDLEHLEQEVKDFCYRFDDRKDKWYNMTPRDKSIITNPTWSNFAMQLAKHFFELGLKARIDKELVEEVYSHLDSIKDTADRMTSGNFMHNRAAIKFSANTIAKVLELMGLKAQKGE